jgi:PAS domain S-box-containing protein
VNGALDVVDAAVLILEQAAPDGPGVIGGKSERLPALRLSDANRCALGLLGAPDCEALTRQLHRVFLADALNELEQAWQQLAGGAERLQLFCMLSSLFGSRLAVKLTIAKIADDGLVVTLFAANPASAIVRRQTEARLAESEARFRTMADSAPVLLWQAGTDARCEFFNEFWLNFTGRDVADELGSGWASGVHPEDFQECMSTYLAAFVERRQFRIEYRLRRHDGQYRWLLDHGVPRFAPDGSFAGYIGSCVDITELKDVYRALTTRLREREMLLREVHHRVKNNLQLVSSLLSMQARSLSDAVTREALNDSRKRVQSIALIHDELYQAQDFSHVAFSEYIRRLCTLVVQATSPSVDRVNLKLDLHSVALGIDRAIPCGLILNELLINAMKHGFADGRSGAIHVELRERETNRIELTVADNGVGLPAGLDVRQAQTVGMQIVCTLAEQLDAVLDVERRGGTTFKLGFFGAS